MSQSKQSDGGLVMLAVTQWQELVIAFYRRAAGCTAGCLNRQHLRVPFHNTVGNYTPKHPTTTRTWGWRTGREIQKKKSAGILTILSVTAVDV